MWSWIIIALISLTCLFCFIGVVQLELRKSSAKVWILLTCCLVVGLVTAIMSAPSPVMQNYAYEPKKPEIKIKELEAPKIPNISVGNKVVVQTNELSVWQNRHFTSKVIGTVNNGDILRVLSAPSSLDWLQIQTGTGLTGWVIKGFVEILPEESEQQEEKDENQEKDNDEESIEKNDKENDKAHTIEAGKKVKVKASELFIRADSNYDAKILGTVKNAEVLKVLDAPDELNWVKIQTDAGLTGWVAKGLVEFLPEASPEQEDGVK